MIINEATLMANEHALAWVESVETFWGLLTHEPDESDSAHSTVADVASHTAQLTDVPSAQIIVTMQFTTWLVRYAVRSL